LVNLGECMNTGTRVVGSFAVSVVAATLFGGGTATADALIGHTYEEAAATIAGWKGTPVIASVVGSLLDTNDCIVTSWHKSIFLDSSGTKKDPSSILVNLNCNAALAAPGTPGNSLATPQGQAQKATELRDAKTQATADYINAHPEFCQKDPKDCDAFCTKYQDKCTDWPA
jgi:hypothetical protein